MVTGEPAAAIVLPATTSGSLRCALTTSFGFDEPEEIVPSRINVSVESNGSTFAGRGVGAGEVVGAGVTLGYAMALRAPRGEIARRRLAAATA